MSPPGQLPPQAREPGTSSPLGLSLRLLGLGLLPFLLARLLLLICHREAFASLDGGQVLRACLDGLRFDLAALLLVTGAPLLLLALPPGSNARAWTRGWGWGAFVLLALACVVLAADLIFFREVQRHVGRELVLVRNELGFLAGMTSAHAPAVAALGLALATLGVGWRAQLRRPPRAPRRAWLSWAALLALVGLGIRGSLDRKPLNPIDAFRGVTHAEGNLALNGVYTALRASFDEGLPVNPLPYPQACQALGLDPDRPHPVSEPVRPQGPPRNVVLVLLESWDVRYCGAYGSERSVTPCFDALAAQGLLFERMFAATQRTIGGVQATLTGIPCVTGVPELGRGLELVRTTRIGALARASGRRSFFLQAPRRRSYYLDSVMLALGFEAAWGLEDIPACRDYPDPDPKWGWDHDAFCNALERIDALGGPFFTVILTGTSHSPYADPGPEFHRGPHERSGEGGYVNTLAYSDWALGEFVRAARARPWGRDTVFILGADHVFRSNSEDLSQSFRIPFLILGPGIAPERRRDVRSQLDVLPTLAELLGVEGPISALGTSLLRPGSGRAVVRLGEVLGVIGEQGWLTHTIEARVQVHPADLARPAAEELERHLLAVQRVTTELLAANRWAPAGPPVDPR